MNIQALTHSGLHTSAADVHVLSMIAKSHFNVIVVLIRIKAEVNHYISLFKNVGVTLQ